MGADSDGIEVRGRDTDSSKDALDVLIDQSQRLFAIYDARRASAEAKAAGILTADVAIAALTGTAVGVIKHVNLALLVGLGVLLLLLVASVIFAVYTGSAAGLRHRTRRGVEQVFGLVDAYLDRTSSPQQRQETPLLSTESDGYRVAAGALDCATTELRKSCEDTDDDAIIVRVRVLDLWEARRDDAHELAQSKDRGVGAAGVALGFALLWGAVLFAVIILWHV
jgi:hypothetical protein